VEEDAMKRFAHRLAWVVAASLCCSLFAVPLQATETEKDEETQKVVKESPLVKASREIQAKKTGSAKTYSNEDLAGKQPTAKVYTNEDLTQRFGSTDESQGTQAAPARPPASGTPQNMPDPLALMEQQQASQAERKESIDVAEGTLAAAQQKLKSLEVQLLATSNPFSARPKLSAEEQETRATSGEDAAARRARTEKMVEEARAEVAKAEADLANARAQ
jgi:hypothetical protein